MINVKCTVAEWQMLHRVMLICHYNSTKIAQTMHAYISSHKTLANKDYGIQINYTPL